MAGAPQLSPPRSRPFAGPAAWLAQWPVAFQRLLLYSAVSSLGWLAFDGFLTPFLRSSGVPVVAIGVFHGLSAAVGAPGAALGGFVADRWGRRAGLLLGNGFRFTGWLVILLWPGPTYLTIVAALTGMGWAASSAFLALVAETAPHGRRASAFAASMIVENIMAMLVPLVTGVLADRFGLRIALSCAMVPAAAALMLLRWVRETAGPSAGRPAGSDPLQAPRIGMGIAFLFSQAGRGALLMGLIWMVTGFQFGLMGPVRPLYVTDRFGVTYAGLGLVTMLGSLGMVLGTYLGGRVADRMGQARLMSVCLTVSGLLYMLLPLATTAWSYAVLLVVTNFAAYTAAPCWGAVGANTTPRQVRGSVTGLYLALRAAGSTVGGLLSGVVYLRSITLPFFVTAGTELAMLGLVLLGLSRAWPGFGRGVVHED